MIDDPKTDTTQVDAVQAAEGDSSPTPEFDYSALEAKVQTGIDNLSGEPVPEQREVPASDNSVPSVVQEPADIPEPSNTGEVVPDNPIPVGHQRAALADGWTQAEIDFHSNNSPDDARELFGKIFNSYQEENAKWAERGRQDADRRAREQAQPVIPGDVDAPGAPSSGDMDALIERLGGDEELARTIMEPINTKMGELDELSSRLQESEQFIAHAKSNALLQTTEAFFAHPSMASFQEQYGTDFSTLTDEQFASRQQLLEGADFLRSGAAAHGKPIGDSEALIRSHAYVSQGNLMTSALEQVRSQMTRRTKATPSVGGSAVPGGGKTQLSRGDLADRVGARLAQIGSAG